ncbi:glycosyltransferase involved in cell wall biosynthesis [Kitasatospora sp. MAA4]|uniref:glycosyltransferase family 2 protein n=1 Tax=Kitasatospora sp. MAA4 TaxID=3035093 RepID=UPI002476FBEF|nr:glycosyltransferase family 2 protein [Kitasatospora sp. MAA4]MDH6133489.1 glycosyltransferase involved in cell wall biosynthesis [Kitasatospora sp. MAA4]
MRPLLSIVLPVHGVEKFLPRCLDSVLGDQPSQEFEVIAVDDRTPDDCGRILDEYAARDPRLRVLHLTENQGLGGARTAALPDVHGEYVWFVDSDDWLPDGALDAVLAELRAERATEQPVDVLLTGFTHVYPDGSTEPNPWRRVLAGSPLEAGCTLAEHPALLQSVMSVWNKIFRKDYLDSLDVSFGRGYYEDISLTYPALLAAARLRYLDRACYNYRRGRPGAITATSSAKHADAFAQYDAIFAFLDRRPSELRPLVFERTVKQALTVYDSPGLVPAELRRDFFHRIAAHFARHRPDGYRFPGGVTGLRYRLAARDARFAYDELRRTGRLPRTLKTSLTRTLRRSA